MNHPAYDELVRRYRDARDAWASSGAMREAAAVLGIDERSYCDTYLIHSPPILWTGASSVIAEITTELLDRAFAAAEPVLLYDAQAQRWAGPLGRRWPPMADED